MEEEFYFSMLCNQMDRFVVCIDLKEFQIVKS